MVHSKTCPHTTLPSAKMHEAHRRDADGVAQRIIAVLAETEPCDATVTFALARIIGTMIFDFPEEKKFRVLQNFVRLCQTNALLIAEIALKKDDV